MPPAVAAILAISTSEVFTDERSVAIRFDLADAALQSFSTLSRLDRPAIDLRSLDGLESSQALWQALPARSVQGAPDRPDAICEETESQDDPRGKRKAREPVSPELRDRFFAMGTWLGSEFLT